MNEQGTLLKTGQGSKEMELLTVFVAQQLFGINVDKIKSIEQYNPELVTSLPETKHGVSGMFLYRNKTIPLMDLSQILDIKLEQEAENEIVVATEFNKTVNGFKCQGVKRIYRLPWEDFIPIDQLFGEVSYFTGSVNVEDTQVLILDFEHILADIFPDLLIEDVSQEIMNQRETVKRDQLEIIFAEDSSTMRKAVMERLQKAGFSNIRGFINGEKAFSHIKSIFEKDSGKNAEHVVLISDIEMPVLDGLSLCRQIKNDPDLNEIYVVMYSSLVNDQMVEKCKMANADICINKPEINQLIQTIDKRC